MFFNYPNRFHNRAYQAPVMKYFDGGGKRAVCVWHRRAGKDITLLVQTVKSMFRRRGAYWHVFPTAEEGRKAIWEGFTSTGERIMDVVFPPEIRASPKQFHTKAEMVVELKNGSVWRLVGSDRVSLVGAGPVGVVFSEYALAKPSAWDYIRPMLRENQGWAAFAFTPRGNNHGKQLFDTAGQEGWFRELLTLTDTRAYDPDETLKEERTAGMPEALIQQEYWCNWNAGNVGAIWADLLTQLQLTERLNTPFDYQTTGIFTSWDLGISDSTAVWFWYVANDGIHFIDYLENHNQPLSYYFDEIDKRGYKYVRHWLPHDARARTLQTGQSVFERCIEHWGSDRVAIVPSLSLLDGLQAGRWVLQQVNTRFHKNCHEGTRALAAYQYAFDENLRTFSIKPLHSWASHGADAFRYASIVVKVSGMLGEPTVIRPTTAQIIQLNSGIQLQPLFEDYAASRKKRGTRL